MAIAGDEAMGMMHLGPLVALTLATPALEPEGPTPPMPTSGASGAIDAAMTSRSNVLPPRVPPEPKRGDGFLAGGITMTVLGIPLTALGAGLYRSGLCIDNCGDPGPERVLFLIPGVAVLAGGVALTALGAVHRVRWGRWQRRDDVALRPSIRRSPSGTWSAGFELRF